MTDSKIETSKDGIVAEALVPAASEMIAKAACNYSREFILKGITQLINNTYDKSQRLSLYRSVKDLREFCSERPDYSLDINKAYQDFRFTIETCKKLSLGNCHEMALMALDYVLRYAPSSINAEVYHIEGGDHVFLVIGRKANSNPRKPETWGEDAFICDPWSDKVYPASEYLTQTKNYYISRHDGDYSNHIENFDSRKHQLSPVPLLNTEYLRKTNSRSHLDKVIVLFQTKMRSTIESLEKLDARLLAIIQRLEQQYPDNPEKKEIIEKMAGQLHITIEKIKEDIKKDYNTLSYETLHSTLENTWKENIRSFRKAVTVSDGDKVVLTKYNDEDSFATKVLRFFKILPKTARDTNHALNEAQEQIGKTLRNK